MHNLEWRQGLRALSGIGVCVLPKVACPICWAGHAALLTSLGLNFAASNTFLLSATSVFLMARLATLVYHARRRRGYGPFLLGLVASGAVFTKFILAVNPLLNLGIVLLIIASLWNSWPREPRLIGCFRTCPGNQTATLMRAGRSKDHGKGSRAKAFF
jgi:mercuric ion transport protein